jgi:hypothetical protein
LVVHRDNRHTPRVRAILSHIAECFRVLGPKGSPRN